MDLQRSPLSRPGPRRRAFRSGFAATSGDTGGAVAHAFHRQPGVRVVVLYPRGKVGPRQEAQFATLGGNVAAVAVRGAFDDCQRLVREAFTDPALNARLALTSANSINIGRLLPQTFYYLHAWAELAHTAARPRAGLFSPFGKLRQPRGRPDRPARARNVPRALRGRHQRQLRRPGVSRAGGLPPQAFRRHHLQRHGRRRSRQLPADPAPASAICGATGASPSTRTRRWGCSVPEVTSLDVNYSCHTVMSTLHFCPPKAP